MISKPFSIIQNISMVHSESGLLLLLGVHLSFSKGQLVMYKVYKCSRLLMAAIEGN